MVILVRGHIAIITEPSPHYITIESTLWFDDVEVMLGLLPLLQAVQRSRMRSRKQSVRWPGNEARSHRVRLVKRQWPAYPSVS